MRAAPVLLLLALAGCGGGDDAAQGGLTRSENRELDQAAASSDVNAMDNKEATEAGQ
jgi:hypothetical protein